VYTTNNLDGSGEKVFQLKIDSGLLKMFSRFDMDWVKGASYGMYQPVYHDGMLYFSLEAIADTIPPNLWFDDNGDNENDNEWLPLFPWENGDYIIIEPYGWYQDGDAWIADLSIIGGIDGNSYDDLQDITVVPNPYIVNSDYFNESPGNHKIRFTRLPTRCDISIYTISGKLVNKISHDHPYNGNEWWNLKNGHNQDVAPGLYIYVVETPDGHKKIDKFAVVR
jgi:hypothetical protein